VIGFLGNSHLRAVSLATGTENGRSAVARLGGARFIQMGTAHMPPYIAVPGHGLQLNSAIEQILAGQLDGVTCLVSVIGGNGHNIFGLVEYPEPFDFFETGATPVAVAGRRLIPRTLVQAALKARLNAWLKLMRDTRSRFSGQMVHLQPPPPIEAAEHIKAHPGPFAEKISEHGIAPANLRRKLWNLHAVILQNHCRAHDIEFIPAPELAFSPTGFLREDLRGPDPAHANPTYGSLVLEQLAERLRGE
jgi:hypothetical protein